MGFGLGDSGSTTARYALLGVIAGGVLAASCITPSAVERVAVVTMMPSSAELAVGGSVELTCTPYDRNGNILEPSTGLEWLTDDPGGAFVTLAAGALGARSRVVAAVAPGEVLVTCTYRSLSGAALITVHAAAGAP